jgi:alpha-L-rhamnosidase
MTEGGPQPVVVLDYGKVVGGIPFFEVRAVHGSLTLGASFSESGRFIDEDVDNGGEGPCCGNAPTAAEPFRWNEFHPTGPSVLRTAYQQGGQRFERIALTSPGRVRLRRVGIEFEAFRATPREDQGWFLSGDDTINKIWYAAAYTDQLNMVPHGAQNNNPEPAVHRDRGRAPA